MVLSDHTIQKRLTNVLGYDVYSGKVDDVQLEGNKRIINTLNAYSYVVAKKDKDFTKALKGSSILLPDGAPVVLAARVLGKSREMQKIAGYDIFIHLMKLLNKTGGKCFFLGASEETLERISQRCKKEFTNVVVKTYSPPFKPVFTPLENQTMTEVVNSFVPDVLFVGMTAPKQEKWIDMHKQNLKAGTICAIGAVFDFYAGTVKRPGSIWIKLGLEWFIRLIREPKRLWKRYLVSSPVFFIDLSLCFLRIKRF